MNEPSLSFTHPRAVLQNTQIKRIIQEQKAIKIVRTQIAFIEFKESSRLIKSKKATHYSKVFNKPKR